MVTYVYARDAADEMDQVLSQIDLKTECINVEDKIADDTEKVSVHERRITFASELAPSQKQELDYQMQRSGYKYLRSE